MVNLTIDGLKVSVPEGTTIMQAAATVGIDIPRLCFLKDINEISACKVCVVEIPDPSIDDKRPCGRIQLTEKEAGERKSTFAPMECGMTVQEACQEAGRCLRCDKFGFSTLKGGRTLKW